MSMLGTPGRDQFLDDESWQPDKEDGLLDTDSEDVLDDGWTAPDDDPLAGEDLSPRGQIEREPLDGRLNREEPDDWDDPDEDEDEDDEPVGEDDPDLADDDPEQPVGRLVSLPDDDDPSDEPGEWQDIFAEDAGVVGDLTAEESAMHLVRDGDGGITDHEDEYGPLWDERR